MSGGGIGVNEAAAGAVLARIDEQRIVNFALDLLRIQSYTPETLEVTERWIAECQAAGLQLEIFRDYPRSPCVVARLPGTGGGPALEINGHLDTVPLPHDPPRVENGVLYGRGATDMKASLASNLEAARAIREAGVRLRGDLLITVHGRHEAPYGMAEDLVARLRRGVHGDAAIVTDVTDVGPTRLPLVGIGVAIYTITIRRPGEITHETRTAPGTPHPIAIAAEVVSRLTVLSEELTRREVPLVGHETLFIGELHSGDFYNRFPTEARIVGTRRWGPASRAAAVEAELRELCAAVERAHPGAEVRLEFLKVRDAFQLAPDDPLARALQSAYQRVTGQPLPPAGMRSAGDASLFYAERGIPSTYHGPGGSGHHGEVEAMPVSELSRAARVLALAALEYCGVAS